MTEQIKINFEDIKENILQYVNDNPIEVYHDYSDELPEDAIKVMFKNTSSLEKIQEAIWDIEDRINEDNLDYIDSLVNGLIDDILREHGIDKYDGDNEDLREDITELVIKNYTLDMKIDKLLSKSTVNVVATIYSNYDCLPPNWIVETGGGYTYKNSYFKDMIDFLNINPADFKKKCLERNKSEIGQKYTTPRVQGRFPNLKHRSGKELINIESLLVELENNSSSANFIFITEMAVDDAIEFFKNKGKAKYLKVAEGTMCGIFSHWQGGGSCLECEVINPDLKIKLKKNEDTNIDIGIELNKHQYSVDDVFGLCKGAFQGGGLQLV